MRPLAGPALLFLLTVGIFWKLVLTNQYTWLAQPDYANQVLPWLQFQAGEWHQGQFPLWDPYHWGGQSLIGQGQPGAAYPLNWILFLLPLRNGWIRQSYVHWYFVLIHFMGALFCYWLCRDLKRSRTAAILAGAAFGLSGYVGNVDWPQMLNGAIWAPVVFLFLLRAMRGESPATNAILAGAALGFSLLSGHHQAPLFVALAAAATWIYYFVAAPMPRRKIVCLAALFAVFVVLTGGLQVLPAYEYGKLSLRWVNAPEPVGWNDPVPYFVHHNYSLGPLSIFGIVIPGAHTGVNPFLGLAVISLALLGIAAGWHERMIRFWGAIAIGGLVFSLGGNSVFHGALYAIVPMVEKARSPGMAILIFHLGAAVLAAYGLDAIGSQARDWVWTRRVVWVALALSAALYATRFVQIIKSVEPQGPDGPALAGLSALLLAGLYQGWRRSALSERATRVLLVLLMLFETGTVTGFYYQRSGAPDSPLARLKQNADIVRFLRDQTQPFRAEIDTEAVPFNFGDWFGVDIFEGFCGVTKNVIVNHGAPLFRDLFALGYYIGPKPARDGQVEIFSGESGLKVYRNPGQHDRAWAVHDAFEIPNDKAVLPALSRPGFDRKRQTFLLGAVPTLQACETNESVRAVARETNRLVIEANLGCRGMVVASETYSPGWSATVDGKPAHIYEAYTVLRGVVVEAGHHQIEMRYRPRSVLLGAVMTVAGLAGALFFWIYSRIRS